MLNTKHHSTHVTHLWDAFLLLAASNLKFGDTEKQNKYVGIRFEELQTEVAQLKVVSLL